MLADVGDVQRALGGVTFSETPALDHERAPRPNSVTVSDVEAKILDYGGELIATLEKAGHELDEDSENMPTVSGVLKSIVTEGVAVDIGGRMGGVVSEELLSALGDHCAANLAIITAPGFKFDGVTRLEPALKSVPNKKPAKAKKD